MRDNTRTFVKAGNAVEKTYISSVVVVWFIICYSIRVIFAVFCVVQSTNNWMPGCSIH